MQKEINKIANEIYLQLELYLEIEKRKGNYITFVEKIKQINTRNCVSVKLLDQHNNKIASAYDICFIGFEKFIKPILILELLASLNLITEEEELHTLTEYNNASDIVEE